MKNGIMDLVRSMHDMIKRFFNIVIETRTAVILWIIATIIYGISLYYCWIVFDNEMTSLYSHLYSVIMMAAYISSIGAIVRIIRDSEINKKHKLIQIGVIFIVYYFRWDILNLLFGEAVREGMSVMESLY